MSIDTHPSPSRLRTHEEQTVTLTSSGDRAILMRLAHVRVHVRVTALSVLGGGFLILGVLAGSPGTAQAGALRLTAASLSPGTSTSASANTDTSCQVLPASSTPSPTPTPTPSTQTPKPSTPTPKPSKTPTPKPKPSSSASSSPASPATTTTPASPSSAASRSGSPSPSGSNSPSRTPSGSPSGSSGSPSSSQTSATASASLTARFAASPSQSASARASARTSASPNSTTSAQPELCVSVQRSQSSIKPGQQAAYTVQVSTENNGSASNVSVALASQPSSQKPTFTSGCAKGNGTAACTVGSVSDKQPANLDAQIPVASGATSVASVTLTATASIVTSVKWTPPSAAESVVVTAAASASPAKSSPAKSSPGKSSAGSSSETTLPLGPIPNLNGVSSSLIGVSSSLIGAGNASSLFPAIIPSATPNSPPGIQPQGDKRNAEPVSDSSALGFGKPGLTGQVAGLIALALAIMLTVTRLSLRKRFRKPGKQRS